jgi:hypothetical protein
MRAFPKRLGWVILGGAWFGAAGGLAQITPAGAEIAVTTTTTASAYQGAPVVAWLPAGDYVVAWQEQSATTGGWDVLAQRYQAGGAAVGPLLQVSGPSSAFCRQFPAAAADAAGDFVIVWQSNEESGGVHGIFGQLFTSAGQPEGAVFQVNSPSASDDQAPAVAMAPDGRFFVVWQNGGEDGGSWGVLGRPFAAGGAAASGVVGINQTTAGAQHSPAVAYLPPSAAEAAERFEVVWQSEGQDGAGTGASGIEGRAFDGAGNALSAELAINAPATGAHAQPRIASDPSGNFVVAWENLTAGGSAVLARRFNAAGTALSGQQAVDASPTGPQHDPAVATNALGEFVVVWDSLSQDGSGAAVLAQQFNALEQPQGGKVQLNTTVAGDQSLAGVGLSAGGSLLMAWQSQTPAADAAVITARAATLPALEFYSVFPCRMVDTRNAAGPFGGPALASGRVRNFPLLASACGVPETAKALSINATAVVPGGAGGLVAYPGDAAAPPTNYISFAAGAVIANNAVLGLSRNGDGSLNVLAVLSPAGTVHFLIDVNGYFQ